MTKFLLLGLALSLVACGGKSDADPAATTAAPVRSGTIDPPPTPPRPHRDGSNWTAPADGSGSGSGSWRDPAARHERAVSLHAKLDTNGDGKLSLDELKASAGTGRMMRRFGDPSAIDADGDGDVSVDELEAAMAKRGGGPRHHGGGGGGGEDDGSDRAPTSN